MDTFKEKLCKTYNLRSEDVDALLRRMKEVRFSEKETIVRKGNRNSNLYFIKSGIWRGYFHKDGVDTTLWFAVNGEAVFSVWGYVDDSPSRVNIEALCDSAAYCIPRSALEELFLTSAEIANLGRRLMEYQFLRRESWLVSTGNPRAKERYLALIKDMPELLQYVPLKYIASYLRITLQSLSRVRASLKKGPVM